MEQRVGSPPQGSGGCWVLVVLPAQSGHHHSQELLKGGLDLWGERVAQLGGDDDGQAVSQELDEEKLCALSWLFGIIKSLFNSRLKPVEGIFFQNDRLSVRTLKLSGSTCSFSECSTLSSA